jgi:hypothetical protein
VEGRERDGVFETEDCIHLIEATVSRSMDKAVQDSKKLATHAKKLQVQNPQKAVKCWFITRDEPTADQRTALRNNGGTVTPASFAQFQGKLIDVTSYLTLRANYPFGSVRDPATGSVDAEVEYISLDVIQSENQHAWSIDEIRSDLLAGGRFIILGDYGSGKSMTLREVYRGLRAAYLKNRTPRFPIYLNLRDHFGQTNPAEVLERHGRNIGFPHPHHLVRAWRAGYVVLLIDGFDELTTLGIQGIWKKLQEIRFRAMEVVRQFIREQPISSGVALVGRAHFFDSERERKSALGLSLSFKELTLNEFSDEQIQTYLGKRGLRASVPNWMPSRPLLVGYLAASGVLEQAFSSDSPVRTQLATDPAEGWDFIVERICAREAEIEAGIDGQTIRRILERLATMARQAPSGLGPLSREEIIKAFSDVCGYQPDEKGLVLLQRLPGLGIDRAEEGTRVFLDEDLADICRAGDVGRFLIDPYTTGISRFRHADCGLGGLGVGLVIAKTQKAGFPCGKMIPAIRKAMESEESSGLVLDLVRISIESGCGIAIPVTLRDIYVPILELGEYMKDSSQLRFVGCLLSHVALDPGISGATLPRFENCYIDEIEGRASLGDLPTGVFDSGCEFGRFSEAPETTTAISGMDLPLGTKVLLTILKKIYLQSGSGRRENALQRGLDHHGRRLVGEVLHILQAEGIVSPYRRAGLDMTIWVPDRAKTARVQKLIASPRTCKDPLIDKAERIL